MEEALRSLLLASPGVSALVGDRVDWSRRPQADKLPAIVLHEISAPPTYTLRGRVRLLGVLVQIDCWATNRRAPATSGGIIAAQVRTAVQEALDALNDAPTDVLRGAFVENRRADYEPGTPDFYRASLDVRVWTTLA